MFSIQRKVLRVDRQKKKTYWSKTGDKSASSGPHHGKPSAVARRNPSKFRTSCRKDKVTGLRRPDCSTDCSCCQSCDYVRLVRILAWECLTLHHVATAIFKGLPYKG